MAKRKRKPKLPPISRERQAIFDEWHVDLENAARLHEQLETCFDKLKELWSKDDAPLAWTGDREQDGNLILAAHFQYDNERKLKAIRRHEQLPHLSRQFATQFGLQLSQFYHPLFGFDVIKFDEAVIKPPEGKSCEEVVRERYGDNAVGLIKSLISL